MRVGSNIAVLKMNWSLKHRGNWMRTVSLYRTVLALCKCCLSWILLEAISLRQGVAAWENVRYHIMGEIYMPEPWGELLLMEETSMTSDTEDNVAICVTDGNM